MGTAAWLVPMLMSILGTAVSAGTGIASTNKQIAAQEKLAKEQQAQQEAEVQRQRIMAESEQQRNNQQTVNQFAQQLNSGTSTMPTVGTTGTTGIGVQGLSGVTGYANDDNLYARCGGKKKLGCGGKTKRKKCSVGGVIGKDNYNTIIDGIIGRTR